MSEQDEQYFNAWQEHQATHSRYVMPAVKLRWIVPATQLLQIVPMAVACETKEEWLVTMAAGNRSASIKPPTWWIRDQDQSGRINSKFAIWHSRYDRGRKLGIWAVAPDQDFVDAGYAQWVEA